MEENKVIFFQFFIFFLIKIKNWSNKMELKEIPNIIIILVSVGMLIGVGLLSLSSLEENSSRTSTIVSSETIAIASLTGNTANGIVTSVTFFGNGTHNTTEGNLVFGTTVNWTTAGAITASVGDEDYLISYVYDANTTTTKALHDTNASLLAIPSTWLPLVVVVAMLAIILVLVLRSFGGAGGRK